MIRQQNFKIFFFLVALESLAANFAHPMTPTIIKNLGLPASMFGTAFAAMSFTNFLFSPFWGKLSAKTGSKMILSLCCVGYGIGQFAFAMATTQTTVLIARCISGFFVGGVVTCFLTMILNTAPPEKRGSYLTICATLTTVFGAFGYLVGGLFGDVSILLTFSLQSITLAICGVGFYFFCVDDLKEKQQIHLVEVFKESNPLPPLFDSRKFMKGSLVFLIYMVLLSSIASTAYDQAFNYYIKDIFGFTSSINGIIKALVGFISLTANFTVCMWILKKTNVARSVLFILAGCSLSVLCLLLSKDMTMFMIFNLVFFAFNAIYVPLLQDLVSKQCTKENMNHLMGFYNSMKSLGMVIGGLLAGFIYTYGPTLPFIMASSLFGVAILLGIAHLKQKKY